MNPPGRVWQDLFGTAWASFEGALAGPTLLVVSPSDHGHATLHILGQATWRRGRVLLAVMPHVHSAPVAAALAASQATVVLAVGSGLGVALSGSALSGSAVPNTHNASGDPPNAHPDDPADPRIWHAPTGLRYMEDGSSLAWHAGWLHDRLAGLTQSQDTPSVVLGLATAHNLGCALVHPEFLGVALEIIQG
jgi:hypothetical protein